MNEELDPETSTFINNLIGEIYSITYNKLDSYDSKYSNINLYCNVVVGLLCNVVYVLPDEIRRDFIKNIMDSLILNLKHMRQQSK